MGLGWSATSAVEPTLDSNNDGIVTRDEMYAYVREQLDRSNRREADLLSQIASLQTESAHLREKTNQLREEAAKLSEQNTELRTKTTQLGDEIMRLRARPNSTTQTPEPTVGISDERIKEIARAMIDDPATNIRGIPDFAERKIYENVLKLFLSTLVGVASASSFVVAGHRVVWSLEPDTPQ